MNKNSWSNYIIILDKLGYFIEIVSSVFCAILFATMFIMTFLGVCFRYIMENPFEWTEELARYLMAAMTFLAINIAMRKGRHVSVLYFITKIPSKIVDIIYYFVALQIGVFLVFLINQGYQMATETISTTSTLDISMFWPYLFVPLGAFLTLIQLIINIIKKVYVQLGFDSNNEIKVV
jgi:TRAP-type C4-dicarboxylate transport system permease small subunit